MLGILIGVLFGFASGGMLLILVFGTRRIEDEIKERSREAREMHPNLSGIPRFFLASQPEGTRVQQLDEAVVGKLQQYLEAEQLLADEFVLQPSVENLYREAGRRLTVH